MKVHHCRSKLGTGVAVRREIRSTACFGALVKPDPDLEVADRDASDDRADMASAPHGFIGTHFLRISSARRAIGLGVLRRSELASCRASMMVDYHMPEQLRQLATLLCKAGAGRSEMAIGDKAKQMINSGVRGQGPLIGAGVHCQSKRNGA